MQTLHMTWNMAHELLLVAAEPLQGKQLAVLLLELLPRNYWSKFVELR